MLAIFQGQAAFGDKAANLATMRARAAEAKAAGAEIVVFPELFLTGYNHRSAIRALAEPRDGASVQAVSAIAREIGIAIVFGFPEIGAERPFNTVALIESTGAPLAFYQKVHLFGDDERSVFEPGEGLVVAEVAGIRVGIAICYDIEFPEVVRALARAGADLIVVPTANMQPFTDVPRVLVRARALESGVRIAYANLIGTEDDLTFCGLSVIVGADGKDLARAGETDTTLLYADRAALFSTPAHLLSTQLRDARPAAALKVAAIA